MSFTNTQNYSDLSVMPDAAYSFGAVDFDLASPRKLIEKTGNPSYSDGLLTNLSSATDFLLEVNGLPNAEGGRGLERGGGLALPQLNASDHPIGSGSFTIAKWFCQRKENDIPGSVKLAEIRLNASNFFNLFLTSNNTISIDIQTNGALVVVPEVGRVIERMTQDQLNLQLVAFGRNGNNGNIFFYCNGEYHEESPGHFVDYSAGTIQFSQVVDGILDIEAVIDGSYWTEAQCNEVVNRRQGTFQGYQP